MGALLLAAPLFGQSAPTAPANQPSPLNKVGYVMLGVADVARAVDFYHGKLGLNVRDQASDVVFFDTGSISIVVSSEVGRQPGDSEVVFAVEHVTQAVEALSRRGVRIDVAPHALTPTEWAASFKDPDGHVLSVFGPQ